jgi:choline dehydrogenase-like flavoprotein
MITDINELEDNHLIEADLCIIGGGAAGITLASELANSGIQVCLLESGSFRMEQQTQALYAGDTSGVPYFTLTDSRCRLFGGSTFRWGGRGAPMHRIDLEPRTWIPESGWPFAIDELEPFYARTQSINGMHAPFDYDGGVWKHFPLDPPGFDTKLFNYQAFQFGKIILFGDYYRDMLKNAANIQVYLHANVTCINSSEQGNHVDSLDIRTLTGRKFQARARYYALACGGIENARLLLLSDTVSPQGLCNEYDCVGRYFMEHPTVPVGTLKTENKQQVVDYYSPGRVEGRLVEVGLALTPERQKEEQCLNAVARVKPALAPDATQALREILWDLMHHRISSGYGSRLKQVLNDPAGVVRNVYRHLMNKPKHYNIDALYIEVRTEQAPNPDSRVTLGDRRDDLGLRMPHLHWSLNELDKHTMRVMSGLFGSELSRTGQGVYSEDSWLADKGLTFPGELVGGHHHMGTTRMAQTPENGVVDRNSRAFSVDNLYIAGSSVFPTVSFVNPTMTILALTLRLADHLKTLYR